MSVRILGIAWLAVVGCKKKAPVAVAEQVQSGPSVEQQVQVVLVAPSSVPADAPTPLQVVGNGFAEGAEVQIGEQRIPARFDNANPVSYTHLRAHET